MRFWLALWALLFILPACNADDTYRTYQNARFGYSVVYPSNLLAPQRESDNGDGRKFRSRDGRITLTVYGVNNALDRTHSQEFNRASAAWKTDGARITLSKLAPGYFALSGFIDNNIFYEKTVFYRDTFCTMIWEYPQELRERLDAPVTRSFASFAPGRRATSPRPPVKRPIVTATKRPIPQKTPGVQRPVAVRKLQKAAPRPRPTVRPTGTGVGVDADIKGGY